jgi:putative mediator of RNA polymerase II transcription subunit 26
MNNRGQNVNPNGTPQNNQPNQGYPQQNSQYQVNGYNGQNQQNFNRNVNNQHPYQNQNPQVNNVNNQQPQGYASGQNPQNTNANNAQFRGQGYNGQNPPFNNVNNPQFRGPGYNGQNPQFGNMNNGQFNNQNGYNNPNQFNPQFRPNNQNFNQMYGKRKVANKTIGIIAAIAAAVVVIALIIFSGSGKPGASTPQGAVEGWISSVKSGDLEKMIDYVHFERVESRQKAISELRNLSEDDKQKLTMAKGLVGLVEVGETKMIDDRTAKVSLKVKGVDLGSLFGSSSGQTIKVIKVNGRWFLTENPF